MIENMKKTSEKLLLIWYAYMMCFIPALSRARETGVSFGTRYQDKNYDFLFYPETGM